MFIPTHKSLSLWLRSVIEHWGSFMTFKHKDEVVLFRKWWVTIRFQTGHKLLCEGCVYETSHSAPSTSQSTLLIWKIYCAMLIVWLIWYWTKKTLEFSKTLVPDAKGDSVGLNWMQRPGKNVYIWQGEHENELVHCKRQHCLQSTCGIWLAGKYQCTAKKSIATSTPLHQHCINPWDTSWTYWKVYALCRAHWITMLCK